MPVCWRSLTAVRPSLRPEFPQPLARDPVENPVAHRLRAEPLVEGSRRVPVEDGPLHAAASALLGILTIPAAYLLGTGWSNHRTGALSAAILGTMLWHVHLSRVGFRAVALPLFTALTLGLGAQALKTRSRWAAIGAGVAYGLSFYTYLPSRFTPFALLGMLIYGLVWHREWLRERWQSLVWMGV